MINPKDLTLSAAAKSYIALAGLIATALLAKFGEGTVADVLTVIVIVSGVITTWAVPNTPAPALDITYRHDVNLPESEDEGQDPLY